MRFYSGIFLFLSLALSLPMQAVPLGGKPTLEEAVDYFDSAAKDANERTPKVIKQCEDTYSNCDGAQLKAWIQEFLEHNAAARAKTDSVKTDLAINESYLNKMLGKTAFVNGSNLSSQELERRKKMALEAKTEVCMRAAKIKEVRERILNTYHPKNMIMRKTGKKTSYFHRMWMAKIFDESGGLPYSLEDAEKAPPMARSAVTADKVCSYLGRVYQGLSAKKSAPKSEPQPESAEAPADAT